MPKPETTHLDYAAEAEAAERAEAWPQAAALWRRAAEMLRAYASHSSDTFDLHAKYQVAADECDRQNQIDQVLEQIAQTKLHIPTLRRQGSDERDFHDLAVWTIKSALRAAYDAGRNDAGS